MDDHNMKEINRLQVERDQLKQELDRLRKLLSLKAERAHVLLVISTDQAAFLRALARRHEQEESQQKRRKTDFGKLVAPSAGELVSLLDIAIGAVYVAPMEEP